MGRWVGWLVGGWVGGLVGWLVRNIKGFEINDLEIAHVKCVVFPKNLKCLFIANETIKIYGLVLTGCGSVVNNTLTSPGYPNDYPKHMHCVYNVPILRGLALEITSLQKARKTFNQIFLLCILEIAEINHKQDRPTQRCGWSVIQSLRWRAISPKLRNKI